MIHVFEYFTQHITHVYYLISSSKTSNEINNNNLLPVIQIRKLRFRKWDWKYVFLPLQIWFLSYSMKKKKIAKCFSLIIVLAIFCFVTKFLRPSNLHRSLFGFQLWSWEAQERGSSTYLLGIRPVRTFLLHPKCGRHHTGTQSVWASSGPLLPLRKPPVPSGSPTLRPYLSLISPQRALPMNLRVRFPTHELLEDIPITASIM